MFSLYEVFLLIAETGKPHRVAEELILLPESRILGDTAAKHYYLIPLSKTTVKWRIEDLADNVKNWLMNNIAQK
jgi:hypothetical protein